LVDLLPPWHVRDINTLVKTPKLHLGDTGLVAALLKVDAASLYANRDLFGQLLETFVLQELRRQSSALQDSIGFFHFRHRDNREVDIVLEQGTHLAGIEVKASASVREEDFRGLRKLQEIAGDRFACGVVLYDGEVNLRFGPKLFALPIATLWTSHNALNPIHT